MRELGVNQNVMSLTGIRLVFRRQELSCAALDGAALDGASCRWSSKLVLVLVLGWCCWLLACLLCSALLAWWPRIGPGWCVCRLGWLGWAGPSKT